MLTNTGTFPAPPELPHYNYPAHTAPLPRGKGVLNVAKFRKDDPTVMDAGQPDAKAVRVIKVEMGDVALRPPPRDAEHEAVYLVRRPVGLGGRGPERDGAGGRGRAREGEGGPREGPGRVLS